jgi:hypothetical protein
MDSTFRLVEFNKTRIGQMHNPNKGFRLLCVATALLASGVQAENSCEKLSPCAAKQCELDAQIEAARKEGSMRKVAMLKDMRSEAARCNDTPAEKK